MGPKDADEMANNVDPDQSRAIWPESTLSAQTCRIILVMTLFLLSFRYDYKVLSSWTFNIMKLACTWWDNFHKSSNKYSSTNRYSFPFFKPQIRNSINCPVIRPTPYATSFRRRFFAYRKSMRHPHTNIILSLFSIPLVLKGAAKILKIDPQIKIFRPKMFWDFA